MIMQSVCLIDDDEIHNFTCKLLLNKLLPKVNVVCFTNPIEAYKELANGNIKSNNLILLDILMPEMNGWKFLDACISLDIYPPTIIITSYDLHLIETKANSYSNVKTILGKPFTQESVFLIKQYLNTTVL